MNYKRNFLAYRQSMITSGEKPETKQVLVNVRSFQINRGKVLYLKNESQKLIWTTILCYYVYIYI